MDGQSFEINRVKDRFAQSRFERDSNIRAIQFLFRSIFTLETTILYLCANLSNDIILWFLSSKQ